MKPIAVAASLALSLAGLSLVGAAHAQTANVQTTRVQGIEILSHGIYTIDKTPDQRDGQGAVANIRTAATTDVVPAVQGLDFGIQYKLTGSPSAMPVKLREVVVYPTGGAHPPGKPALVSMAEDVTVPIGTAVRTDFYSFEEPWELIPGTWTFQVWYGNQKIGQELFTVVRQ